MEGHETSDWNSYYADTQEVSKFPGSGFAAAPVQGRGGPGGGQGSGGGSNRRNRFAVQILPTQTYLPLPPAPKLARLPQGKHSFQEPWRRLGKTRGGCEPARRAGGPGAALDLI